MQATFQTRLRTELAEDALLDRWGELYARVQHHLFAAYSKTGDVKTLDQLKSEMCARHGITARHFNAVSVSLKGKIASRQAVDKVALSNVKVALASVRMTLTRLERQKTPLDSLQRQVWAGKKRRLARLKARAKALSSGHVALCFGSRKLFRAQFDLAGHGYADHTHWQDEWRRARSGHFFLLGSKDESGGNQSCTATVADNGTLNLRLRLPDALRDGGVKYLVLDNVWFEHGQWELYSALDAGQAISYRFVRDQTGWRVFASTERVDARAKPDFQLGAVGVDINADHLAVADVDRHGNLVHVMSVPCLTHGKTSLQRQDAVRVAAKAVVAYADRAGKPLVREKLDFSRRKQELGSMGAAQARRLSSFAYGAIQQALDSNALLRGVPTAKVNPAYTSVIGRVKYAKPLGVSVHQAAALAIARRGMGYGEAAPARPVIPDGKGDHLIVELPVRNRSMHEWSHWAKVRATVQGTLAGWHRLRVAAAREAAGWRKPVAPLRVVSPMLMR